MVSSRVCCFTYALRSVHFMYSNFHWQGFFLSQDFWCKCVCVFILARFMAVRGTHEDISWFFVANFGFLFRFTGSSAHKNRIRTSKKSNEKGENGQWREWQKTSGECYRYTLRRIGFGGKNTGIQFSRRYLICFLIFFVLREHGIRNEVKWSGGCKQKVKSDRTCAATKYEISRIKFYGPSIRFNIMEWSLFARLRLPAWLCAYLSLPLCT